MRNMLFFLCCFAFLAPGAGLAQTFLPKFDTVMDAHLHCPYDAIVWIKAQAGVQRYKGQPKSADNGGYVCRQEAIDAGYDGLIMHLTPMDPVKKPQ